MLLFSIFQTLCAVAGNTGGPLPRILKEVETFFKSYDYHHRTCFFFWFFSQVKNVSFHGLKRIASFCHLADMQPSCNQGKPKGLTVIKNDSWWCDQTTPRGNNNGCIHDLGYVLAPDLHTIRFWNRFLCGSDITWCCMLSKLVQHNCPRLNGHAPEGVAEKPWHQRRLSRWRWRWSNHAPFQQQGLYSWI